MNDKLKPELFIYTESKKRYHELVEETHYPYIHFRKKQQHNFTSRLLNKFWRLIVKNNFVVMPGLSDLDMIYPLPLYNKSNGLKKIYWIPDFQEHYLPRFFSKKEVASRKRNQAYISKEADIVVCSSEDAGEDFRIFFPQSNAKTYILKFAVSHVKFNHIQFETLKMKYCIPKHYFYVANQFWAHKNHLTVLKALLELKQKGIICHIVMSGNQSDYRNKDNFKSLTDFIETNGLTDLVKIVGFIPREEQLCLLKNAKAVIQPSLFEGWSTVVEDVKALQKLILVSDLKVHREQLENNALFFDPLNSSQLAEIIEQVNTTAPATTAIDYSQNIKKFGMDMVKLIDLAT